MNYRNAYTALCRGRRRGSSSSGSGAASGVLEGMSGLLGILADHYGRVEQEEQARQARLAALQRMQTVQEVQRQLEETQRQLVAHGVPRYTPIQVTTAGIIYDGNHAARAAGEVGKLIHIEIIDAPATGHGSIMDVPIIPR